MPTVKFDDLECRPFKFNDLVFGPSNTWYKLLAITFGYRADHQCRLRPSKFADAERPIGRSGVQTVQFDVLECGPFISTIGSADRQIHRVGAQLIKFADLACRPSNSAIESAEREIRRFREQTVKFDDLEYPLSDSSIGSADLQFATSFRSVTILITGNPAGPV